MSAIHVHYSQNRGGRSRHPTPTVVRDVRGSSQFTQANAGTCGYLKLRHDRFVQRPPPSVIQLSVAIKTKLLTDSAVR